MEKRKNILKGGRTRGQSGNAMVELCLLMPWIFFLFFGVMDAGFYAYATICTQNAARAGAVRAAQDQYSQVTGTLNQFACVAAWKEMSNLPNVYSTTIPTDCGGLPSSVLTVTTNTLCGSTASGITGCTGTSATSPSCSDCDGAPWDGKTDANPDKTAASEKVTVTYTTVQLVPVPGIIPGKLQITRIAEARIIQE